MDGCNWQTFRDAPGWVSRGSVGKGCLKSELHENKEERVKKKKESWLLYRDFSISNEMSCRNFKI